MDSGHDKSKTRRSERREFRKKRQKTGVILFCVLALAVLGGLLFFGADPSREAGNEDLVERAESPKVDRAPEAVVKGEEKEQATKEDEVKKEEGKEEPKKEEPKKEEPKKEEPKKEASSDEANIPEPASTELYLTVPKMGIYGDYVANDTSEATLYNGAGKITETGFPWQPNSNTYIASHVYGYPGTGSWQHFAALPSMTYGDQIILTDANGTEYVYQVTEILQVSPYDVWVTSPVPGKDMVSLQTCVGPGWSERMVVRGERIDVKVA